MAQIVADWLVAGGHEIDAVIASPLQRAQETAAPAALAYGVPVGADERLIEADSVFENSCVGAKPLGLLAPRWWPKLYDPFRPSWGEPYREQADRVLAAVADARAAHLGGEVLLVSHQLPIWVTRLALEGKRLWHSPLKRQCSTASITSLRYTDETLTSITYAEPAGDLAKSLSKDSWSPR